MAVTKDAYCDCCGGDVMNGGCSGEHCAVCQKEIAFEVDGPVYADDSPTAQPAGAFACPGCLQYFCDTHRAPDSQYCPACEALP